MNFLINKFFAKISLVFFQIEIIQHYVQKISFSTYIFILTNILFTYKQTMELTAHVSKSLYLRNIFLLS